MLSTAALSRSEHSGAGGPFSAWILDDWVDGLLSGLWGQ